MSEPSIIERSSLLLRDVTHKPVQQGLLFLTLSLGVSIFVAWLGFAQTAHHDPIIGSLIWTGRLAFLIFLVPLFARPLRILFKSSFTATMMRWRRNAGICYGASQSVHLVIVCIMFATVPNPPTETVMVIVGATGLALSLAMLITSFPTPTKFVGTQILALDSQIWVPCVHVHLLLRLRGGTNAIATPYFAFVLGAFDRCWHGRSNCGHVQTLSRGSSRLAQEITSRRDYRSASPQSPH